MNKNNLNLKYTILPGKFPNERRAQNLHNVAYLYWKQFWNDVFKENGTDHVVNPDDFTRHDKITLITHEENIVGMHLYCFFNTESLATIDHSYFKKSFTAEYTEKLKAQRIKSMMSMECLAISPNYRKRDIGFSVASVLIGLACKHQEKNNTDSLIGASRADIKVTQLVLDFGGEIIVPNIMMHNTPVDLMSIHKHKVTAHPDETISKWIHQLWETRTDYTETQTLETFKIAA